MMFSATSRARKAGNYLTAILSDQGGFMCSKCFGIVQYVDGFICPLCGKKAEFRAKKGRGK